METNSESPSTTSELNEDSDAPLLEPRRSARTKSTDLQGPKWCPRCSRKMRKGDAGQTVCGRCLDSNGGQSEGYKSQSLRNTRSNLIKPLISGIPTTRPTLPKGKGRRSQLKRIPQRLTNLVRESYTRSYAFLNGQYFQIGDVVSLMDEQGDIFYAQITGMMHDHNYQKSATIAWLIPKNVTENTSFDPSDYSLGPRETVPRMLESMHFEMHLPPDFFRPIKAPYRTPRCPSDTGFVWVRLNRENENAELKS
ncbi:GATA zinc finger domain-containing protein 1-like [Neocloeon triangulifer]|uniref:GATA zinc finger domain-containing protein 1-like n=1 Tax=Neocloeon triangulifer TaxID=2078957 RepID=UPI00286F4CEB|nr:GATA zinc finger domain-containing protein 1-like [Neocloeon triangulifer]